MKIEYKTLKNALLALVLAGGSVAMTSCEDTLEQPSYTADDLDYVFADLDRAEIFVKGCYRGLIHEEMYRQYNTGETVTLPCEEDLSGSKYYMANFHYDANGGPYTFTTTYKECYRIIEGCNVGIKYVSQLEVNEKQKALLAELYTIRAYAYHNLIRIYGDVPMQMDALEDLPADDESTFYPKRHDRDDIYDKIIADVREHVEDLPWQSEAGYGTPERLTRQAAYGVLARICLHAGGYSLRWNLETLDPSSLQLRRRADEAKVREFYQIADDALAKIIQRGENSLLQASNGMSGYQTLWFNYCQRNFGVTNPEMLWQMAELGTTTNCNFGVYNGQPGSTGGAFGQRKTLQCKLPTYYLSFDPKDTRRDVNCTSYTINFSGTKEEGPWVHTGTTYSSIMSGKFRIQWCTEPAAAAKRNVDIPMLRYADVLLMYAETQNFLHNGPTAAAIDALRQVRQRAGIGDMAIPTGQEAFLDAVMQERKWELADEFTLRTDLIRTDLLDKNIKQAQQDLKDLSARTGKYASVPEFRLYQFSENSQTYGDSYLAVPYIDITDPAEIKVLDVANSKINSAAKRKTFQEEVQKIAEAHGKTGTWYACNMFDAWQSTYNRNCRQAAGFSATSVTNMGAGLSLYTKSTGLNSRGDYPDWVEGLYFDYQKNKVEIIPFANISPGHPMVDNPNLTQHPAYK